MKKILFVCLGNICRSPLAEAIFQNKIAKKGLQAMISSDSCGTANFHVGQNPDERTIAVARRNRIPISHIGMQIKKHHLEEYDLILPMDKQNMIDVKQLASESHYHKIKLFRDFDPIPQNGEVPDPWFGDEAGFDIVYEMLDRTCDELIKTLKV